MILGVALAVLIVLPADPTPVERSAAAELADGIGRMTGAVPQIAEGGGQRAAAPVFYVGRTSAAAGIGPAEWKYDEIFIGRVPGGVVLSGHPQRGPIYAVDTYLEDVCGVRWWTSTESHYPRLGELPMPTSEIRYAPRILYRESYFKDSFHADFKVRMKGNFSSLTRYMLEPMEFIPPEKGGDHRLHFFEGRRSAYHSFFQILPPERHFAAHPDWYSMGTNGVRQTTQLCLSNDEMTEAFVRETRRILRADPDVDFISISQNDASSFAGMAPCACPSCRAIEEEEGGVHSGPILRFANRVAEALEREFPNVRIDTFAYSYSRQAPRKTKARHNVVVRFCDIGCPVAYPMDTKGIDVCEKWMRELAAWRERAPGRMFIWDYVANFSNYMLPHPNLYTLASNIRIFAEAGAIGVFEQGDALCAAGDFARLKHYLVSHLLWNPDADDRALLKDFTEGYYGRAAAPHLYAYHDLVNLPPCYGRNTVNCYHDNVDGFMFPDAIFAAEREMKLALGAAEGEGEPYASRVRREKLSIDHAVILNWDRMRAWTKKNWEEWPYGESRAAFVERWARDCRAFGVVARKETVEPDFEAYAESLQKDVR